MDRKLKEQLLEESEYPQSLKEEIWTTMKARLDAIPVEAMHKHNKANGFDNKKANRRQNKMKMIKWSAGTAAAALAIIIFFAMPPGEAFMKNMQRWFASEKKIEIEVEGQKEVIQGQVHINEERSYAIYYDKERYKLVHGEDKDILTTIDPLPEPYPQVSLTIEQAVEILPEQMAKNVAASLAEKFKEVHEIEKVTAPVNGYLIRASSGHDRLSELVYAYVVSNKQDGSYILTSSYFLEAAEGHGARFSQMLEQFEILKPE